jgi:hypothetical protein
VVWLSRCWTLQGHFGFDTVNYTLIQKLWKDSGMGSRHLPLYISMRSFVCKHGPVPIDRFADIGMDFVGPLPVSVGFLEYSMTRISPSLYRKLIPKQSLVSHLPFKCSIVIFGESPDTFRIRLDLTTKPPTRKWPWGKFECQNSNPPRYEPKIPLNLRYGRARKCRVLNYTIVYKSPFPSPKSTHKENPNRSDSTVTQDMRFIIITLGALVATVSAICDLRETGKRCSLAGSSTCCNGTMIQSCTKKGFTSFEECPLINGACFFGDGDTAYCSFE